MRCAIAQQGWQADSTDYGDAYVLLCATGVTGLTRADAATEAAKTYAIALADTVLVPDGGAGAELLTANAARTWTDNAYFFNVRLWRFQAASASGSSLV